jgi:putative ABC transport system ATP-binding protein
VSEIDTEEARAASGGRAMVDAGSRPSPTIEARGIARRKPKGEGWLLRDVSLSVRPGDRIAVVGPSGAGKTVLLRALALLDPLDEGAIYHHGAAVRDECVPSYRKGIIYVHQRPALFEGSVEENLRHPFALKAHRGKTFDRRRTIALLEGLGREESFLAKSTNDLSGGEGQVVALIRAIQLEPEVLLLDEPAASLDPAATHAVECLVGRWYSQASDERSLVWVSHDVEQVRRMTRTTIGMEAGRLQPGP